MAYSFSCFQLANVDSLYWYNIIFIDDADKSLRAKWASRISASSMALRLLRRRAARLLASGFVRRRADTAWYHGSIIVTERRHRIEAPLNIIGTTLFISRSLNYYLFYLRLLRRCVICSCRARQTLITLILPAYRLGSAFMAGIAWHFYRAFSAYRGGSRRIYKYIHWARRRVSFLWRARTADMIHRFRPDGVMMIAISITKWYDAFLFI